jgi:hypothetical protein
LKKNNSSSVSAAALKPTRFPLNFVATFAEFLRDLCGQKLLPLNQQPCGGKKNLIAVETSLLPANPSALCYHLLFFDFSCR